MCLFITTILPEDADLETVRAILSEFGYAYTPPIDCPAVETRIEENEIAFRPTLGMCDCGAELGAQARLMRQSESEAQIVRKIERLRRKGWTQAKIERWLEQKGWALEKNERALREREKRNAPGAEQWAVLFRTILGSGRVGYVGLLLHWCGHCRARGAPPERELLGFDDLTAESLMRLEEEVVYIFEPQSAIAEGP